MSIHFKCPQCGQAYEVLDSAAGKKATCRKCSAPIRVPNADVSLSPSGAEVRRYTRAQEFAAPKESAKNLKQIEAHVTRFIGEPNNVWHEIVSDKIHLDVLLIPPSEKYKWHTLVTSGMSDLPMEPPDGDPADRYAELLICLPPEWDVSKSGLLNPDNFWPIESLKFVARLPHEYGTWLGTGHTIPNGDPPEPFHHSTKICCWLLYPPIWFPDDFSNLVVGPSRTIKLLALIPLYEEEMNYKLQGGLMRLANLLDGVGPRALMRFDRPNVCAGGFFRRRWFWVRGHRWTTGGAAFIAIAFIYATLTGSIVPPALQKNGGQQQAPPAVQPVERPQPLEQLGALPANNFRQQSRPHQNAPERSEARRPISKSPRVKEKLLPSNVRRTTTSRPRPSTDTASDRRINPNWRPEVGDSVEVLWGNRWWPASIIDTPEPDQFKIHYEGWSDSFDEVVGMDRLRSGPDSPSNHE